VDRQGGGVFCWGGIKRQKRRGGKRSGCDGFWFDGGLDIFDLVALAGFTVWQACIRGTPVGKSTKSGGGGRAIFPVVGFSLKGGGKGGPRQNTTPTVSAPCGSGGEKGRRAGGEGLKGARVGFLKRVILFFQSWELRQHTQKFAVEIEGKGGGRRGEFLGRGRVFLGVFLCGRLGSRFFFKKWQSSSPIRRGAWGKQKKRGSPKTPQQPEKTKKKPGTINWTNGEL